MSSKKNKKTNNSNSNIKTKKKQLFKVVKDKKECSKEEIDFNNAKKELKKLKGIYDECRKQNVHQNALKEKFKLKDLLLTINNESSNNVIDLLKHFPHPGSGMKGIINTDSHVYEALWIIIFLFNYDELLESDNIRKFKKTIEGNKSDERTIKEVIETTNVNESNSSGICDIYFYHEETTNKNLCPKCKQQILVGKQHICEDRVTCNFNKGNEIVNCGLPACDTDDCKIMDKTKNINKNYLFSAKYFNKEKGIEKYDIPSMFIEALPKLKEFNIMLLVKDKEELEKKMDRSKKQITKSYHKIMDLSDLDKYYKQLKYDLDKIGIEKFITQRSQNIINNKTEIKPRFHQQYFIDYSIEQFNKSNYKLCWGAVPRSGKSYMIGGLIAKKKPKQVVIFLGAVTETIGQFDEMFKKFSDFDEYNKVNVQIDGFNKIDVSKKNIILISQQKGWRGEDGEETDSKLLDILKEKNKIIFFDEIHQGSSIGIAQEKLLIRYIFNKSELESPFIMVTATFAKPLLRYMNRGKQKTKLIQWSYDDIQTMKDINSPYKLENFLEKIETEELDNEEGEVKTRIIKNLIKELDKQGITLDHLSKQYDTYPELVVLCPELEDKDKIEINKTDEKDTFDPEINTINKNSLCDIVLKCNKTKFLNERSIKKYIEYIEKNVYGKLLSKRFGFKVREKIHSQLWFLPTPAGCQGKITTPIVKEIKKIEKKIYENEKNGIDSHKEKDALNMLKEGTGIENLTRLLAQELTKNKNFKEHFCILVINSQKLPKERLNYNQDSLGGHEGPRYNELTVTSYDKDSTKPCISTHCVKGNYERDKGHDIDTSIADCIKEQESCAKAKGKSLIILTGMRLRLGISLPCVDIVLHMDPIRDVDTIYQSMFRVLTENKKKTQGFFVDMISDRFIDFMYQYDNYTNKGKKNIDVVSKKNKFIEKLFNFNINGIVDFREDKSKQSIYLELIKKLNIDSIESFADTIEDTQEKQIKEVLDTIDDNILNRYYKDIRDIQLVMIGKKSSSHKLKVELDKPQTELNTTSHLEPEPNIKSNNSNNNNNKPITEKEKEKEKKERKTLIISYIKDIFSLFILFEAELLDKEISSVCSETNIDDLLKFLDSYTIEPSKLKDICTNNKRIIDCHISYLNKKHLNFEDKDTDKINENVGKLNKYRSILVEF